MNLEKTALILVLMCGFLLSSIPLASYEIPLSWEGFYHARIAQNFAEGKFYDTGSFGPDGRPSVYPPAFHAGSAFLMKILRVDGFFLARWVPPFMFCALIVVWYYLISQVYQKSTAVLSSLFLLAIPAFLDLGFLFSPHSFALILIFFAFIFVDRPVISGVCGGIIIMTQFSCSIFFFLVLLLWSIMDSAKRKSILKITGLSLVIALPYIGYFLYNTPSLGPVLGNPGLKYFFMKTTFCMTACTLLGLRKDVFAVSLGVSGFTLSVLQPTNFCFLAFPLALFSSFFVRDFFSKKKWSLIAFIFLFWLLFIPSQEYVSKLQPAASEYESFVWLKENSVDCIIASGWYQAPIIAFVSERVPVLGFGFPEENRLNDTRLLYEGDETLLDLYDVSYVYFGKYEEYDYNSVNLLIDKVYSGKGSFFKREPPLIYVLITIDVEPDLPPVLTSYDGIEEGLPFIIHLLDTYNIPATFFVLGETAELYPDKIRELAQNHEIGCHSLYHEDLRALSYEEKEERVVKSTSILQELAGSIVSFRAPGHSCDSDLIEILTKNNYCIEASADNQHFYPFYPLREDHFQGDTTFLRVPVSHTPSYFYAPLVYPHSWVDCYTYSLEIQHEKRMKVIVIGLHPWEFISLEAPGYTLYTQACGEYTRSEMEDLLRFLHARRVQFVTMRQLYDIWEENGEKN
jgi:peptidoglycan/xylan/chitin deacetylase (PgdA/CDA1 family)